MRLLANASIITTAIAATTASAATLNELAATGATLFNSGGDFILRSVTKTDLCLSDGGSNSASANTPFVYAPCDATSVDQVFRYDSAAQRLRSVNKSGLCVMRRAAGGTTILTYRDCSDNAAKFEISYDATTYQIRHKQTAVTTNCLDDSNSWGPATPGTINTKACNSNMNQQFLPQATSVAIGSEVFTPPSPVVFKICASAQNRPFCLADTSSADTATPADTEVLKMIATNAYPYTEASWFVYVADSQSIRSWRKPSLCITTESSPTPAASADTPWFLSTCDEDNKFQKFAYNDFMLLLSTWDPRGECMQVANWNNPQVTSATCRLTGSERQNVELRVIDGQDPNLPCPKLRLRRLRKSGKQRK